MSAIASTLRRRWIEIAWGVFALANVAVIVRLQDWETIPFHLVWVSLTLVYGFRVWRVRTTIALLAVVLVATVGALAWTVARGSERPDELAEGPLMAAMFLAMVWHAHRRQLAIREAERLAESEHRMLEGQREFVRDASHGLRTPITIARGHAELIRASGVDGQVAEDAEVVLDELGRLSRLSERLLLLTTAGDPRFLTTAEIDVEPFVVGLMRRWTPAAPRAWQVAVGAEGRLVADRERLETALDAILENAVKATGDGGSIRMGCRTVGRRLVLEVADDGAGIRAEDLPRIFDRFATLGADGSRDGGTGLGLSIAKAIVEAHGGTIAARSELGRGTTVRIELPGFRPAADRVAVDRATATDPSVAGPPVSAASAP